jgi:hypothetical protein
MTPIVLFSGLAKSGKDTAAAFLCDRYQGAVVAFADPIKRFLLICGVHEEQLWGNLKEVEFDWEGAGENSIAFAEALEEALNGWKSLDEIDEHIDFKAWLKLIPKRTTGRHLMQTFGTECVRAWNPDFWCHYGHHVADVLLTSGYGAYYERTKGVLVTGDPAVKPASGANSPVNLVCFPDGRFRNEILRTSQRGGLCVQLERPDAQAGLSEQAKRHVSETGMASIPPWFFGARIKNDSTLERLRDNLVLHVGLRLEGSTS